MRRLGWYAVVILALALFSCGKQPESPPTEPVQKAPEVSAEDVKKETKEAIEAAAAYTVQQKEEYQQKMDAKLDEFDGRIGELEARAANASAEAKVKLAAEVEKLQEKQEAARKKLDELKSAGEQAWEDAKADMDSAMNDLEDFMKRLIPSFE